jgi:hypothetical protein
MKLGAASTPSHFSGLRVCLQLFYRLGQPRLGDFAFDEDRIVAGGVAVLSPNEAAIAIRFKLLRGVAFVFGLQAMKDCRL